MAQLLAKRNPHQNFGIRLFRNEGSSTAPVLEPLGFSPLAYLRSPIDLDPNIRLGDLLEFVRETPELHPLLERECFISSFLSHIPPLNTHPIPPPAINPDDDQPLSYLRLSHSTSVSLTQRQFDDYFDVSGIALDSTGKETAFGISFSNPTTLLHLPLVLKTTTTIGQDDYSAIGIPPPLCADVAYPFTLFDFLYEFFWELSFHGSIEETQSTFQDLKESIEEIKNNLDLAQPVDLEELDSEFGIETPPN